MRKFIWLILLAAGLVSCGGYQEGTIQKSDAGYLKFVGNLAGATATVDDGQPFALRKAADYSEVLYKISEGRHTVKVYRDGKLVVERIVLLDDNAIKEVQVP